MAWRKVRGMKVFKNAFLKRGWHQDFSMLENDNFHVDNRVISMTEISKSQRCHIQVLSQLNRDSAREGRKPRLTDLKGSGGLEENASLALFLVGELDSNEASLNVQKARSGKSGWSIPLVFNPERLSFGETYY